MDAEAVDLRLSGTAAAVADPARARMLCSLLDGRARTATELAALADIGASTASGHFARLREQGWVEVTAQGRHRYYRLANKEVATALEALLRVAGASLATFEPSTPLGLRHARTCYDHMAGEVAVILHDALVQSGWLLLEGTDYLLTEKGEEGFVRLGVDLLETRKKRRRFAYPCLDWSERRPHLGGALAAALLTLMNEKGWLVKSLDSRALQLTAKGAARFNTHFGAEVETTKADCSRSNSALR
ncbi:transcriptional regulator [Billgrantia endophytica]|uniref:Transcriptional regulator n=2 Tax=Billgrantia endophytica TaxID=2033802 RepID=A0A2N7U4N5_9GAMM|nr:transcriptional regulator [Halomonas endophytica]